jgi:hypothetical protein
MKWHASRYVVVGFRAVEKTRKATAANYESGGQEFELFGRATVNSTLDKSERT